jgi:hypothetical protein
MDKKIYTTSFANLVPRDQNRNHFAVPYLHQADIILARESSTVREIFFEVEIETNPFHHRSC